METAVSANPLFVGADPDIIVVDDQFWIYPTFTGVEEFSYAFSSPDLKRWTKHGPILHFDDVSWIKDDGAPQHFLWAPGVFTKNGKFYLYFSVGPQNPTPSRIGVAVATHPAGPFVDSGQPLITGGDGFEAIDAMVFEDPQSGKVYLYSGGSAGATLRVFELNEDLISIKQEVPIATPENFTEASFMHFHDGKYYFTYSHGRWNDDSYRVAYSTAPTPTGPWTYQGVILSTNDTHVGPGHHCILKHPRSADWYIIYHRWNGAKKTGVMPATRSVAIDKLEYDAEGRILPVVMTDA